MNQSPEVSAVIVAYKTGRDIVATIEHHRSVLGDCEIIVIDNASGDDTASWASRALPEGRVIANRENLGYGAAINQGLRYARAPYVLILNDDARLQPGAFRLMRQALEADDRTVLAGPRIVDATGNPMPSARFRYPGLGEEIDNVIRRLLRLPDGYPQQGDPTEAAWLVGACILAKTDLLRRIGGFNPAFFLYGEDIDLGRRLVALGYRSVTVPEATCIHMGESSTGRTWSDRARVLRRMRARDLYARIWLSRPERMLLNLRRTIGVSYQPERLFFYLPRVFYDGPSLKHLRFPPPLIEDPEDGPA